MYSTHIHYDGPSVGGSPLMNMAVRLSNTEDHAYVLFVDHYEHGSSVRAVDMYKNPSDPDGTNRVSTNGWNGDPDDRCCGPAALIQGF